MGFNSWAVLPGLEDGKYILAFRDTNAALGQPFGNMSDDMSEEDIRAELKKLGKSEDEINSAITRAKAKADEDRNSAP
jgi:hypothetical protein